MEIYSQKGISLSNHLVVRMMGVYSLNEIGYSDFVIGMMKVYFPKGINRLACGW
jgi:hypothetical protein